MNVLEDQVEKLSAILRGWRQYFSDPPGELDDMNLIIQAARIYDAQEQGDGELLEELVHKTRKRTEDHADVHYWIATFLTSRVRDDLALYEIIAALLCTDAERGHPDLCRDILGIKQAAWETIKPSINQIWQSDMTDDVRRDLSEIFAVNGVYLAAERIAMSSRIRNSTKDVQPADTHTDKSETGVPNLDPSELSDDAKKQFMNLFQGREGVTAKAVHDADGRVGYSMMKRHFDDALFTAHLNGDATYALFLIRSNQRILFACIDIDIRKRAILKCEDESGDMDSLLQDAHQDAVNIVKSAKKLGVPVALEDSGYKGRHVWIFFESPVEPRIARNVMRWICDGTPDPSESIHREFFPKSDRVKPDKPGDLIKLPLGINRRSMRRSLFIGTDGSYPDQSKAVMQLKTIRNARLAKLFERFGLVKKQRKRPAERLKVSLSELKDIPLRGPIKRLLKGCVLIRYIVHKAQKTGYLTHFERLAVLYTIGFAGDEGKAFVHRVIAHCVNYDPGYTQQQIDKMKPSAISCPRLREHFPNVSASLGCNCRFDLKENGRYPTPILHADLDTGRSRQDQIQSTIKELNVDSTAQSKEDTIVRKFLELRRQYRGVTKSLKRCESDLEKILSDMETDRLDTALGILIREMDDSGSCTWRLEI